jgi:alpha-tectorin
MFILPILTCIIVTLQCAISIESTIIYPFGPSLNDISLPKSDDDSYGLIVFKLPFYNKVYSKIYINTNGLISFLSPISKTYALKNYIPISTPLISPFWSDINTLEGGQIYYRESSCSCDLNLAKTDISNVYSYSFNPSRVYIITWDQVAAYNGNSSLNNTFQVVIATDELLSFLIFNFGDMAWPNSQFSMNSFFGYNTGDNINSYSYPDSFTNNITSVSSDSNVNIPGKWVFMVFEPTVYSLATNVTTFDLINQGYKVIYNHTYGTTTLNTDMTAVYNQCNELSIICLGGAAVGSDSLLLVSCANCYTLLKSYTVLNQPILINNAYWYYTSSYSVGFSPSSIIVQNSCDWYDMKNSLPLDPLRLCWHLSGGGGWRIGSIVSLNSDSNYLKLLFLR